MKAISIRIRCAFSMWLASAFMVLCVLGGALAQQDDAGGMVQWKVPVVMEESTLRGRVVVLETRREDRRTIEGMTVQVWSQEDKQPKDLLHETETDDDGLFDLPELPLGQYFLVVSRLRVNLVVIERAQERVGQEEPKILLIMIPKEVV